MAIRESYSFTGNLRNTPIDSDSSSVLLVLPITIVLMMFLVLIGDNDIMRDQKDEEYILLLYSLLVK